MSDTNITKAEAVAGTAWAKVKAFAWRNKSHIITALIANAIGVFLHF